MKIQFTKMHGIGNDFIILDCTKKDIPGLKSTVKRLSDRRFGIGFDQALILRRSKVADFKMEIYNADGGRVEMCGNGIRCLAQYVWSRKLSKKKVLEIETLAGIIRPSMDAKMVRVDMGEPELEGPKIPVMQKSRVIKQRFGVNDSHFEITCVSMGNPHCVIFVEDVDAFPVHKYGPLIETNKFFPNKTNVEFVQIISPARLKMRVWERGAGETLACGTGACAAAVAAQLNGLAKSSAIVQLRGGNLKINWAKDNRVYMTGPAQEVYSGSIDV